VRFPIDQLTRHVLICPTHIRSLQQGVIQLSGVPEYDVPSVAGEGQTTSSWINPFGAGCSNPAIGNSDASEMEEQAPHISDPCAINASCDECQETSSKTRVTRPCSPGAASAPSSHFPGQPDVPALLAQLDGLGQHGVEEAEFPTRKRQLLARMYPASGK